MALSFHHPFKKNTTLNPDYKRYTKAETYTIFRMYSDGFSLQQIADKLKEEGTERTIHSIRAYLCKKKIKRRGGRLKYTKEILQYLRTNFETQSNQDLAKEATRIHPNPAIEFTARGIGCQLQKMKLYRSTAINKGRFKKGATPWNKNKPFHAPGRSKETRFKKGRSPHNTRKVGEVYLRSVGGSSKNKVYYIKHTEGKPVTALHVYNWTQKHGSIPKGHIITFKDGNPLNITKGDCTNLECISRSELLRRNYNPEKAGKSLTITNTKKRIQASTILDVYMQGGRIIKQAQS